MNQPTSPSPLEKTASVAAGKQQAGDTAPNDESIYSNVHDVLAQARSSVTRAVNGAMVNAYWEIGRQINEAIGERAEYGKHLLSYLSKRLTDDFGKGFTIANLRNMRQFYQVFPIRYALRSELSWSHYRLLMRVDSEQRRLWCMNEAADAGWSSRQLDRQIQTLYYDRLLATQGERNKKEVAAEIQTTQPITAADSIVRDPYVLEFLDIPQSPKQLESTLEQALIDKLQDFLLELGRGFAFVGRQVRISDGTDNYYIDLVFYNYLMRRFVLVDLKTGKLTHQDVGQMDFYVRLYEEKYKPEGDNPPIGIILCSEKTAATARYSVLADKDNLFASQYMTYLPTEEELERALRRERDAAESVELWNRIEDEGYRLLSNLI